MTSFLLAPIVLFGCFISNSTCSGQALERQKAVISSGCAGLLSGGSIQLWIGMKPVRLSVVAGRPETKIYSMGQLSLPQWLGEKVNLEVFDLGGRKVCAQSGVGVDPVSRNLQGDLCPSLNAAVYGLLITTSSSSDGVWRTTVRIPAR